MSLATFFAVGTLGLQQVLQEPPAWDMGSDPTRGCDTQEKEALSWTRHPFGVKQRSRAARLPIPIRTGGLPPV